MAKPAALGRLFIAWGPEARDYSRLLRNDPYETFFGFINFHAGAINNDPDPFASAFFGAAVKALLGGKQVVLTDQVFSDPARRNVVQRAFQRVFPDLVIEQRYLGEDARHVEVAPGRPDVVIDDDVYAEGEMSSNESIVVESDAPRVAVVEALTRAAERMMTVGDDGLERDGAARGDSDATYTPNDVSDVMVDEDGNPGFSIDCKGAIEPPMQAAFRQILVEELSRGGVTPARVRTPD